MSKKIGLDCKLYYDETPLSGGPNGASWTELDKARDVNLNLEAGEADITARDNDGWRAYAQSLKDGTVEFEMIWDPTDAGCEAIRDAFMDGSTIAMAVMDGDLSVVWTEGFTANFEITGFSQAQPLEEGVTVSVTCRPKERHYWWEVAC